MANLDTFTVYKIRIEYIERIPEHTGYCSDPGSDIGEECLKILFEIEPLLENNSLWLFDNKPSYLDIAILPFVRQYRIADMNWFDNEMPLNNIKEWLNRFLVWDTFEKIMIKNPLWEDSKTKIYFGQD